MSRICFDENGWNDYVFWQKNNKNMVKKINNLIKDNFNNPFSGTGDPIALKGDFNGFWSRKIDDKHRLVYTMKNNKAIIVQCRLNN